MVGCWAVRSGASWFLFLQTGRPCGRTEQQPCSPRASLCVRHSSFLTPSACTSTLLVWKALAPSCLGALGLL